jgi:hypothetical protein
MRLLGRSSHASAADQGGPSRAAIARAKDAKEVLHQALDLRAVVESVNPDEFAWQEAHYDHDSRQGREMLFLMANHEWVRATSEVVDITRSDEIETAIKVDIDLSQITHEAFRKRTGRLWLPVAVLLPQTEQRGFEPDLFATVSDAEGNPVPILADADLRHQMSAAMAEIIAKMAVSHLPSSPDEQPAADLDKRHADELQAMGPPVATRDEQLLLSAAIYRVLRHSPSGNTGSSGSRSASETYRITQARKALLTLLDSYIKLLKARSDLLEARINAVEAVNEVSKEPQFAPELARRAIKVLQTLTESMIVVVQTDYDTEPSALTVKVPTRKLEVSKPALLKPWTWIIRPCGRLEIGMLLPTADASRKIQVNLPDGVSVERPVRGGKPSHGEFPHLDISVHEPRLLQELSASMEQVFAPRENNRSVAVAWPFVDLAWMKSELALHLLRHYQVSDRRDRLSPPAGDDQALSPPYGTLRQLAAELDRARDADDVPPVSLKQTWQAFRADRRFLFRRTSTDLLNPQTVVARAGMIEDTPQRANPRRATVSIDVIIDDRDYFSTARYSAFMSLILMLGVLCFLAFWPVDPKAAAPAPEVLAIVLTLFVTIQADRIERPDRSTLRGQLFALGNWLIAASVLPAVTLALALAFQTHGHLADFWAVGCVGAQLLFLALMWHGPLMSNGWPRIGKRRIISTSGADYGYFEVLRSDYWRNTTADALMIGRKAYGYAVWQKADPGRAAELTPSPKIRPLLIWDSSRMPDESSSVLALLRSGTLGQAITFVVFRGRPAPGWPGGVDNRKELDLDPGRLAPADSVTSRVDVFVGVHRDEMLDIRKHPLVIVLKAAKRKLIVLDVQLPVPTPVKGYGDRQWSRIRVALRDGEDISRLTGFLDAVVAKMTRPRNSSHVVAVQTVQAGRPRVIIGPASETVPACRDEEAILVLTRDLDVVNGPATRDEDADARTWRVLTICADARSNVESDIIKQLSSVRKQFQLAGLTYALLHATAVIMLLVHEPEAGQHADGRQQEHDRAALEADLRKKPALAKVQVLLNKQLSRDQLQPVTDYPMLRVHFRWQDRPGAFLAVFNAISAVLSEELPSIQLKDWSVSYARLQVLTGQVALGRLTIRMHIPAEEIRAWSPAKMEVMGRKIEVLAAFEAARGEAPGYPGGSLDRPEDPLITIDRITKPGPD